MAENTYYDYINAFYDLLQVNPITSNAQLLYYTLLMIFNKAHWVHELQRTNYNICSLCGIGEKALTSAKNELKQLGLIDFISPKKKPTIYRLCTVKMEGQTQVKGKSKESQTQVKGRTYKDKREKIEDKRYITPIIPFEGILGEKVSEWLKYKQERGQKYKPTGLNCLFKTIQSEADKHGEAFVLSVIDKSITNNWQGLFFDAPKQDTQNSGSGNVFLDMLQDKNLFN
ncbi:MAG: hypothetical protein HFE49_03255 [Clostridia bacterium]|nr:hypothetical protein [Clostridia bacterium]